MQRTQAVIIAFAARTSAHQIRLCLDQDFGNCGIYDVGSDCWNVPGNINDQISSADTGNATCTFYVDGSCGGGSWTARGANPTVPANFNDVISSVRCY